MLAMTRAAENRIKDGDGDLGNHNGESRSSEKERNYNRQRQRSPPTRKGRPTMRQSYVSVVFAAALVFHSYEPSGALPMSKAGAAADDDNNAAAAASSPERDAFASLLGDKAAEIDGDAGADGGQRFIVIATPSLWRDLRDLRALSGGAPPLYKRRANFGGQLPGERADANQDLSLPVPVQRRDMRCMVGRVYRPCWEV